MTHPTQHDDEAGAADDGGLDPVIVAVLGCLRDARAETPGRDWSLAKLGKRSQVPMSTLRRTLTQLDGVGLTRTVIDENGLGHAALTEEGAALAQALFGEGEAGAAQ